jgi:glycosyltransferase involved in cell wall biosynthesis/GT2 family glycosyltransferase
MFEKLPSLRGFQPRFYSGGPTRFYLPLFYDLVATAKPRRAVVVGFGDGQAFLTLCQAASEQGVRCQCTAVRRGERADAEGEDLSWREGKASGEEFYGDAAQFFETPEAALSGIGEGSIDLLLLDDCDSGAAIRADLKTWERKLSPGAVVLLHGIELERDDSVKAAWEEWAAQRPRGGLTEGLGLAVAGGESPPTSFLLTELLDRSDKRDELAALYALAADRIEARARALQSEKSNAALKIRQVWLDSFFADRSKAQHIMDEQAESLAEQLRQVADLRRLWDLTLAEKEEVEKNFEILRRDRVKAQLVMDSQEEQLRHWIAKGNSLDAQVRALKAQVKEQKQILKAAREACRKKGRCFQIDPGEKVRRSFGERIARELRRLPRNLGIARPVEEKPASQPVASPDSAQPTDPYLAWIEKNEPNTEALDGQRRAAADAASQFKVSLLTPVHDTPATFLDEMFASVVAQTWENWELCIVDGGSTRPETIETLRRWEGRDRRIRIERLPANLGIAENSNRALLMATGDFIACLDHDDLLPPFALYELARAALENPDADILYSDEDRLSAEGKRHSPFFKPEWSPELLLNSMYIGHLSAYRRFLALELNGFRKEFDLSQDYDFALRATERARAIHHIPKVLYHWREHPASGSTGGKAGARATNLAALADAMRRRNLPADILEYPTANRARLKVARWPRVSVIVPTDSPSRAQACLRDLPQATKYSDLEIVVVTNSKLAEPLQSLKADNAILRLIPYDRPFNFSDKCNVGAAASTGDRLIFFNDDVEATAPDWIQNLIEPLENREIGAVAPKLLYESGKIQHAGLVTGVRGLVGTACHQWPADSADYTNFAQSMRDVSALSAACLAMRRDDFFRVGEFDAVNTPIAHSDLDLCFKVREAGMRCVYTPFVTMTHRGHASIGAVENEKPAASPPEKASVFLLKRWGAYTTHDPYFPDNIRDWLYADSPTPIRMWSRDVPYPPSGRADLLFVSHDLSWSGAPLVLLHTAKWCKEQGYFVTIMAPVDGPLRNEFVEAGFPVVVDPLIITGHSSFAEFAREFDCVVASTIFSAGVVRALKAARIPNLWWIHEGKVAEHYIDTDPTLRVALTEADFIVTPDTRSSRLYQPFSNQPIRVLFYGIPDPGRPEETPTAPRDAPLKFLLLGTVESRKGQQVLLEALALLSADVLDRTKISIVGRPHDPLIADKIRAAAKGSRYLEYREGVSPAEAHDLIRNTDVMVSASWDETGPIILMEALAFGKPILSTTVGAVAETVSNSDVGLFFKPGDAQAMAGAIERLVREPELMERFARNARPAFDQNFSFERFAGQFGELVEELVAGRRMKKANLVPA